jgi:hypothetical protein
MSFYCYSGDCEKQCEACETKPNINFEDIPSIYTKEEKMQFEHEFYKKAENFREEIKVATLKKAALKYKEPFNPSSWTIDQLAKHAMAENYDQQNYIYGMYERLLAQEAEITLLKNKLIELQEGK